MLNFNIDPVKGDLLKDLQHKIDNKTKPRGALGMLESLALKIGCIQNTLTPELKQPAIVVFAGDHGIAETGVSLFPQEVPYQMVLNFLRGGAAINVFCKQNDIKIKVVDSGVKADFDDYPGLIKAKIDRGTKNFLKEPAMSQKQCQQAIQKGSEIVEKLSLEGTNIIGFGEMGIANTSSATVIFSKISGIPLEKCVGRGTGLDDQALEKKRKILNEAINNHDSCNDPLKILETFGGFEIAMMTGAMLKAAELKMILMIDGFIATSALIPAAAMYPDMLEYCIFAHTSNEQGHRLMLEYLNAEPLINLNLRLGEGTGAAVAYPVVESAVCFLNEMASFKDAQVSKSSERIC